MEVVTLEENKKVIALKVMVDDDFLFLENPIVMVDITVHDLLKIFDMKEFAQKYFKVIDLDNRPSWEGIKLEGDNLKVENCQMAVYKDAFNFTCNIKNTGIKLYTEEINFNNI